MTKKRKLLTTMLAASLLLTACSTITTNKQNSATQNSSQELSKEDLIKKVFEANQSYKSVDLKSETLISPSIKDKVQSMKLNLNASSILEPLSMKIVLSIFADSTQLAETNILLKDNTVYIQNPEDKSVWAKTTNQQMLDEIKQTSNLSASDAYINIFTSSPEKLNVNQKDGKYEITYTGDGAELQKIAEDMGKTLNLPEEQRKLKYKQATVKYTVNKKTYFAEKVEADLILASESLGYDLSVKSNVALSNHNQVAEITLPEEAKSAISIP